MYPNYQYCNNSHSYCQPPDQYQYQYQYQRQQQQQPSLPRLTWFGRQQCDGMQPVSNLTSTNFMANDGSLTVTPSSHQMECQRQYCQASIPAAAVNYTPLQQQSDRLTAIDQNDCMYRHTSIRSVNPLFTPPSLDTSSAFRPMTSDELSVLVQAVAAYHHPAAFASRRQQQQQFTPTRSFDFQRQLMFATPSTGVADPGRLNADDSTPTTATAAAAVAVTTRVCGRRRRTSRVPHKRQALHILETWYEDHRPRAYADRQAVTSLAAATQLSEQKVRKWLANNRRKHGETCKASE